MMDQRVASNLQLSMATDLHYLKPTLGSFQDTTLLVGQLTTNQVQRM
jgi:hypothetical protein